jgi:multisubunit Na+/H+ antiporter MnhG subunit
MNKIRILGLVILVIGIIIQFAFENDGNDFISGLLIGIGVVLLITGKIGTPTL